MSKGLVLVIDDDEWVGRLLAVALRESGYEVAVSESAADGFFRAVEATPDCIVCDVDLPDQNGFWVARKLRSHPSRVSMAPLIFLSGLDDQKSRLEGFQVGGDAYITKPFRIDEVVAQVEALILMAQRLKKSRKSMVSVPPDMSAAMVGNLAQMSVATVLTLLDLERRSGKLELTSGTHRAIMMITQGAVATSTLDGGAFPALDLLRKVLAWSEGRFEFHPGEAPEEPPTDAEAINGLLMEAARLEDEERGDDDRPSILSQVESAREAARASSSEAPDAAPPSSTRAPDSLGAVSIPPDSGAPISVEPISVPAARRNLEPLRPPAVPGPQRTVSTTGLRPPKPPPPPKGSTGFAPALRSRSQPPASVRPGSLSPRPPSVAPQAAAASTKGEPEGDIDTGWSAPPPSLEAPAKPPAPPRPGRAASDDKK